MKPSLLLLALLATFGLSACVAPEAETYPLSGEECGPEDPVLDLDAADCVAPGATGAGGF